MCLAVPGKITELREENGVPVARVDFGGVVKQACTAYVPEAKVGDYVLVHVGFAISVMDEDEAAKTLAALQELGELSDGT